MIPSKYTEKKYLATFHTQSAAIQFEKSMKAAGHYCKLKPVPRKLSSSCGICAMFSLENFEIFVAEDLEHVYYENDVKFELIFTNE